MYHNFITEEDEAAGIEFEEYSIHPDDFEADLIWLKENGYTTITSRDLIDYLSGKVKTLPEKSIILSIDDGTLGVYTHAWPLLKKYGMKADFNVIGHLIDETWEKLREGDTRDGETAPYCTWEELAEMSESGEMNICSHTYDLHTYDRSGRIGMDLIEGESIEDYIQAIKDDYELAARCIGGWVGIEPTTVAYPYSKRHAACDEAILKNTGYKVLMADQGSRGTLGNYFVDGCDMASQFTLMSRLCRMDGTPISEYISMVVEEQENLFMKE
jgi:peptidoglycan/xylan/chitin deacetylase (PgdA/CDA1 family)